MSPPASGPPISPLPEVGEVPHSPIGDSQIGSATECEPESSGFYNRIAFLFSAFLSPYIVIPVGTVVMVAARPNTSSGQFWLWTAISIFFSTGIPALYVVSGMRKGNITDVHVMEREQRGGPFVVAIVSSLFAAVLLYQLRAPTAVWGLNLIIAANGFVLWAITLSYKISMHVAVLSAVILAAVSFNHAFNLGAVLWLVPALIWARRARGRHSEWQGIFGCMVATGVTAITLTAMRWGAHWHHQLMARH